MEDKVKVKDLWVGDRFYDGKRLWTKLDMKNNCRAHEAPEMKLKERGYGYIGSMMGQFEPDYLVKFDPATPVTEKV